MNRLNIFAVFLFFIILSCSKEDKKDVQSDKTTKNGYDEALAERLGADDYGMSRYVVAFLKEGSNRDQDSTTTAKIQEGHMANINKMAEEGKLVLAGPFIDGGEYQGIYVFNVATIEEAEELTKTDPAIQAGRLVMELKQWYGSAALKEINSLHGKIAKVNP